MTQYTRRLLGLALALALLASATAYGVGVLNGRPSQAEAAITTVNVKYTQQGTVAMPGGSSIRGTTLQAPRQTSGCGKHRLSQRQILWLGNGPLTQRAARALICGPRRPLPGA